MQDCWIPKTQINKSENVGQVLQCYSAKGERIFLEFLPCFLEEGQNVMWEDWHRYKEPLLVYETDYNKLLLPYLESVFPLNDPISGEEQAGFDVCWDNWIGESAWKDIIQKIQIDIEKVSEDEFVFYDNFLRWLNKALENTTVIVVEGNL